MFFGPAYGAGGCCGRVLRGRRVASGKAMLGRDTLAERFRRGIGVWLREAF
jgi:hypothetical protein